MTTLQATKDPLLRGVSPTPSKIPVRSQRRPPLPTVKPSALDQENQDPRVRGAWGVKTVATRTQHTPATHPNAEPQLFVLPSLRDWCRSSVVSAPSLTQQAPGRKPHIKQSNRRDWWGVLSFGTPWRSSGLALGDKMWDLGPLPRQVPVGGLKTVSLAG